MKLKSSSYFNAKIDNRGRMMHYRDFGKTGMKTSIFYQRRTVSWRII